MELRLQNTTADRERILPALRAFAQEHSLPHEAVRAADLALEEHVTNILNYAYQGLPPGPHTIRIQFAVDAGFFQIEIEDDGRAFNPLDRPPVDITRPLEERPVGGLGVHLIRSWMDEVAYERRSDKNLLRLRKRIAPVEKRSQ